MTLLIALFMPLAWSQDHSEHQEHLHTDGLANELMIHGNAFLVGTTASGPRGVNTLSSPNMLMAKWEKGLTEDQKLTFDLMLTAERWTYPDAGYPELLQVGEEHSNGEPYIDFQHPHSSPIMEIGVSHTLRIDEDTQLKVKFAPRGESTDGPIPFMHRITGAQYNPDAPLGHHVGQDVGHISSTVVSTAISHHKETLELSGFHGEEPKPTKVDLPMGSIDSFAARWTHDWTKNVKSMVSWANVKHHEHHEGSLQRTSASFYGRKVIGDWQIYGTFVFGENDVKGGEVTTAHSFLEEFLLKHENHAYWARLEQLQRSFGELMIDSPNTSDKTEWVEAITLGFTQRICKYKESELRFGVSETVDFLPGAFKDAYGSLPMTGRVFLQLTGMKMWQL